MTDRRRNPFLPPFRPGVNAVTRVCLVGASDVDLRAELLGSETAQDALASYELGTPFANCVTLETISLGAAVSMLNDLDWYLRRYTTDALVLEPSVDEDEWLSRLLATAVRNEHIAPEETGTFLKIYGLVPASEVDGDGEAGDTPGGEASRGDAGAPREGGGDGPIALAEPLFARRIGGETPGYDLRTVVDTLVVRVTPEEFGA